MLHELKIKQCYLMHILEGMKKFEVRKNDRDYQVGDRIQFLPLEDENYDVYKLASPLPDFEIIYVHAEYLMKDDIVILGIKRLDPSK